MFMMGEADKYEMDFVKDQLYEVFTKGKIIQEALNAQGSLKSKGFKTVCEFTELAFKHNLDTDTQTFFVEKLASLLCPRRQKGTGTGGGSSFVQQPCGTFQSEQVQECFAAMPKEWVVFTLGLILANALSR